MFRKPFCKVLHDRLWLLEAQMLLASEAAHSQGFRDKLLRNRASSPVEGLIEQFFENHCSEAHHRELCRNRPIRFDIHNDVAHFVPEDWALNRYYSFSTSYARWLFVTPTESGPDGYTQNPAEGDFEWNWHIRRQFHSAPIRT